MFPLALTQKEAEGLIEQGFSGIWLVAVLFVSVVWIIFPFLVYSKLNALILRHDATNLWLKKIAERKDAENAKPPTLPPLVPPKGERDVYRL